MKPVATFALIIFTTAELAVAQTSNGGWRRVGDAPPSATSAPAQAPLDNQAPAQSADRSDEFGQPQSPGPQDAPPLPEGPQAAPPPNTMQNDRPYYGVPQQLTVKAGTFVTVRINQGLNSDRNREGDIFSGTLAQPVVVDGIVVAQRGETVYGRVAEAKRASHMGGVSHLGLQLTGLTLVEGTQEPIHSQLVMRNGRSNTGAEVGTVAATTAVGAAIGAAADWGRGAAIGAGAGAAAGIAGVLLSHGQPTMVYPETVLTFQLTQPVTISTVRAPQAFRYVDPNDYDRPVAVAAAPQPRLAPRRVYAPYPPYYYGGPGYYPYYGPYYGVGLGVVVHSGRWHRW
jgi:hypothetical protein